MTSTVTAEAERISAPLGQIFIERGLIAAEDLDRALELQRERRGEKIGKILMDMGYIAQRDLLLALSVQLSLPIAQLAAPASAPELEGMSPRFLRQSLIFPLAIEEGTLTLAMADPLDFETINAVQTFSRLEVNPQLAGEQEILDAIDRFYNEDSRETASMEAGTGDEEDLEHLRDMASEAPVIRLVNAMIARPSKSVPAIFTSSPSTRNSAFASAWTEFSSIRNSHPANSRLPSFRASS